jgi:RecA-family ATPase
MDTGEIKNTMLEATLRYRKLDYSVIPVGNDKKPLVKWERFQTELASEEEIKSWFLRFPNANVGIVTGAVSGLVVVDVEKGGLTDDLPPTVMSKTGGGGFHYYYRRPDVAVKNGVRIGNKEDLRDIRGDGGYVVAPPSLHASGEHYEWITPPESVAGFADFPMWLIEQKRTQEIFPKDGQYDWEEKVNGVSEGERNNTAAAISGKLLAYLPAKDWEGYAWPLLRNWNKSNNPPLPDMELRSAFDSIAQRQTSKESSQRQERASFRSQLIRAGEILTKEFPEEEWLVEDIVPLPSIVALSGMPGHGKTFVTIHIAMCVARGLPVFGRFASRQAPVLVISEEDYPNHLQGRFKSLGLTEDEQITYLSQAGFKSDNKENIDQIIDIVREGKFKLVIVDSLRRVHDQDENDSRGMARVAEGLKRIAKEGVAVLYIHHHRKPEEHKLNNPTVSLRGSTEIQAAVENHFALEKKDNEDILVFRQPKSRNSEALKPFEVKILKESSFNEKKNKEEVKIVGFEYIGDHDEKKQKSEEAREAIVAFLKSEGIKSRKQIHEAMKAARYGQKAIDEGIHDAAAAEEIEIVPKSELPPDLKTSRGNHYRFRGEPVDPSLPPLDEPNVAVFPIL